MLDIDLSGFKDPLVRDAFYTILEEFRSFDVANGKFKHYELTFTTETTNFRYAHNLGFKPKDAWFTSIIPNGTSSTGTAEFNYSLFSETYLDITTTGPCIVRFFVGSFVQGSQA